MIVTLHRPAHYHTPRTAALWLLALRRLWALGLTDARIADLLSGLSADAIRRLKSEGWTVERAEDLAAECNHLDTLPPWTARSVMHHRQRLGLAARSDGLAAARAERAYRRRRYQSDHGWGHLLPSADARGKTRAAGFTLRRRDVEVLCLLRDRGPLTRGELYALMGVRRLRGRAGSTLARLVRAGLVCTQREGSGPLVFALGKAARCPSDPGSGPRQPEGDAGDDFG